LQAFIIEHRTEGTQDLKANIKNNHRKPQRKVNSTNNTHANTKKY